MFSHVRAGGYYFLECLQNSFVQRINLHKDGEVANYYETGVGKCESTTYEIVQALAEGSLFKSEFMSDAERRYVVDRVQWVEIFDRNGDRQHMTCISKKPPLSLLQRVNIGIAKRLHGLCREGKEGDA